MDLSDRMKRYEDTFRYYIPHRMPVVIRIDGRAFHTLTKKLKKPFDEDLACALDLAAIKLIDGVQNSRCAYIQSDEISLLLVDYNRFDSQQWFDGNLQKMASISASMASGEFNKHFHSIGDKESVYAMFDSRVFILPEREVVNYFIWRQQDATRNSIQMVAQSLYSHNQLLNKSCNELEEMIFKKGVNWNDYPVYWKRGRMVTEFMDRSIPIFTQNREYIEKFMEIEEE